MKVTITGNNEDLDNFVNDMVFWKTNQKNISTINNKHHE